MKIKAFIVISLVLAAAVLLVTPTSALFIPTNGQDATLVLGKPDFTSQGCSLTQSGICGPRHVAVDPTSGKIFVADFSGDRVLRFANMAALSNGAAAEAVLGQTDFTSNIRQTTQNGMGFDPGPDGDLLGPMGVAVDTNGRLWVVDVGNNRVLRFDNAAAKANGSKADGVLGQSDFTNRSANTTQNSFNEPLDVSVDASGRLWVADTFNERVLRFDNAAAKANGANADGVFGQPDFTSSAGATTQNGMRLPGGVSVDTSGRLYVADSDNNRVLVFNAAASLPNGANASFVLGQTNFTTGTQNTGGLSAAALDSPFGVAFDPTAKVLLVADVGNNRVVMYGQPYATISIMPFIGLVNYFLAPGVPIEGKISIRTREGVIRTFDVTRNTRILPDFRANQIKVGTQVTILARFDNATGRMVAVQIILHTESTGPGFPTLTPTITSVATNTPTGTPSSTSTATPTETSNPAGVPTSTPTETATDTATPAGVPGTAP